MNFDPEAQAAVDLAKRAVAKGAGLDLPTLLAAVVHGTPLKERYPQLATCLTAPKEQRGRTPTEVDVDESLQPVLDEPADSGEVVTADDLVQVIQGGA